MDLKNIGLGAALAVAYSSVVENPTEKQIRQMVLKWDWLVNNTTPEKIADYYHPEAILLPTFDPNILKGREAFIKYFTNLSSKPNFRVQLHHPMDIQRGYKMGIASGLYTFSSDEGSFLSRFTFVFKASKIGGYRVFTHHSSVLPTAP